MSTCQSSIPIDRTCPPPPPKNSDDDKCAVLMHSTERNCTFTATNDVYDNTFMPANDQINEMVRHQTVPLLLQLA